MNITDLFVWAAAEITVLCVVPNRHTEKQYVCVRFGLQSPLKHELSRTERAGMSVNLVGDYIAVVINFWDMTLLM